MSDKSESFNEWWEMFELHCISSDEKIKVIEIVESAWNHQQKKIDKLEEQLRGERQATKTFSEHLNNERVRHGSTEKKLQAAEEKLTECASNYWKEVEKRKAAEEKNRVLREAVEFYARKENWTRRGSQFRLADYGEDDGHSYRYGYLARQALEKVRKE